MPIDEDSFEEKNVIGFSDCLPMYLTNSSPLPHGAKIICEKKVPGDPWYEEKHEFDDDGGPLHSGEYVYLIADGNEDLEPYSYWTYAAVGTDKINTCTTMGVTTMDDSINDIVEWVERHFENLSHYWNGYQVAEIMQRVASRINYIAWHNDPIQ